MPASFLSLCLFCLPAVFLIGQTNQTKGSDTTVTGNAETQSDPWFKIKLVAEKVWRIEDHGADNMYLVEGKEKALFIDTGLGVADLSQCIQSITKLPVLVVNTHGHPDHAGGNFQFEKVYAHPLDFDMIKRYNEKEQRQNMVQNMLKNSPVPDSVLFKDPGNLKPAELVPVRQGYVFDLGQRKLEVVEVPGHTRGSIALLDSGNKILFTGDNDNLLVWIFLNDCLPLESYLQTLQKLNQRANEFDVLLPGHGNSIDKAFIGEQIVCAQNILNGNCAGKPYNSFAGKGLVCSYKRAAIAYNPENLRSKP
jgi:hydroxyacylglutathione hydrolase